MADPEPAPRPPDSAPSPGRRVIRPVPARPATRLAGLEALSYEGDMNWRRGIGVLWTLFALLAVAEACRVVFALLSGFTDWPTFFDMTRLWIMCTVFLALWFGNAWIRWVLAVAAFFYGVSSLMQVLMANELTLRAGLGPAQRLPGDSLANAPLLAAGTLYIVLAFYLAFSADVIGFARHRREAGRAWVIVPVALLLGGYLLCMLAAQWPLRLWLHSLRPEAENYARESLRAMAAQWDPAVSVARGDPALLDLWGPEQRKTMTAMFAPLGPLQGTARETFRLHPVFDEQEDWFSVREDYQTTARFVHGEAVFRVGLAREFFGPWRVHVIAAEDIRFDPPSAPPAPPAATPATPPVPSTGG